MITQYFDEFVHQISLLPLRSEVIMEEVPPPSKLAPHAYAVTAEIPSGPIEESDDYLATGRFVLLPIRSTRKPGKGNSVPSPS